VLITAAETPAATLYEAIDLPGGAKIISGELEIVTVDAGGGKIAVSLSGTALLAATASTPASRTAFTDTGAITTAPDTVDVTISVAVLTTAVYRLTVEYTIDGRSNEVQPVAI
jgi:hypothetical protein